MEIAQIAQVTHDANRAYCHTLGDTSQDLWVSAPAWQKESAINGVTAIVEGKVTTPEQSHKNWMAEKQADGWIYGAQKNPATKTHPCLLPYSDLPADQRVKDALFFAVVRALA